MIGHGWLAKRGNEGAVAGVPLDAGLPTRFEEFSLLESLLKAIPSGYAWDAGTGERPLWHIAPFVIVGCGWKVLATDKSGAHLKLPSPPGVERRVECMEACSLPDGSVDLAISISVIEHCRAEVIIGWVGEVLRVVKQGGYLFLTADNYDPTNLASMFSREFDVGERAPDPPQQLSPKVGYLIAKRKIL